MGGSPAERQRALDGAAMQLLYFVYDTIGRMYSTFMFEIMRDFPDTEAAVLDCAACMKRTSLHKHFVDELTNAVCARLLHPGECCHSTCDATCCQLLRARHGGSCVDRR